MPDTEADKHIFVNNFNCDLSPDITRISAITMRIPKIETTTGLDVAEKTFRPGRPIYGNIVLEGAEHKDGAKKIRTWVKTAYDGDDARKDITITLRNQKKEDCRTFNLIGCLPVNYSTIDLGSQSGAQTLRWRVEVNVQRIDMK